MKRSWRLKGAVLLNKVPPLHRQFRKCKQLTAHARQTIFSAARSLPVISGRLAKGYFSVYESLKGNEPRCRGRIVLEDQGRPEVDPQSVSVRSGMNQHAEQPWPIVWSQHDNARLISRALTLVDDRNRVCLEAAYSRKWLAADPAYTYLHRGKPLLVKGNWTSIVSRWVPVDAETNLAHWLFDALPRLALLPEFPTDTRVIVPADLQKFQTDTLNWLGLSGRYRPTPEKSLQVEHYFFSSPVSMIVCYSPYAVSFLREKILPFRDSTLNTPKRFLVRRTGPVRNASNEAALLEFFEERQWTVVDTATMPLNAQIQLFSQAEAVCGVHGAGLAHVVWCAPGCKVIELFSDKYLSGCYELLCGIVGARYRAKIFPGDTLYNAAINLREIDDVLRQFDL